jgi:hypothetical protein
MHQTEDMNRRSHRPCHRPCTFYVYRGLLRNSELFVDLNELRFGQNFSKNRLQKATVYYYKKYSLV